MKLIPGPHLDRNWFRQEELVMPDCKVAISPRVDREVLDWFNARGSRYQSRKRAGSRFMCKLTAKLEKHGFTIIGLPLLLQYVEELAHSVDRNGEILRFGSA